MTEKTDDRPSLEELREVVQAIEDNRGRDVLDNYDHGIMMIFDALFSTDKGFRDIIPRFIAAWIFIIQYGNANELYMFYRMLISQFECIAEIMEEKETEEENGAGQLF